MDNENLRFPAGRYVRNDNPDQEFLLKCINIISEMPVKLKAEVENLNDYQLDTTYRVGGWTIRQVVHHIADSHVNAYVRFKLALTENSPVVKTYEEALWAEVPDARQMPIEPSLKIIDGIHERWIYALNLLAKDDFNIFFIHPENNRKVNISNLIDLYAWHCRNHLGQIKNAKLKF